MSDQVFLQSGIWAAGDFTDVGVPVLISALNVNKQTAVPPGVVHNGVGDYTVNLQVGIDVTQRAVTTDASMGAISHYERTTSTDTTIHILVTDMNGLPADAAEINFICVRTAC